MRRREQSRSPVKKGSQHSHHYETDGEEGRQPPTSSGGEGGDPSLESKKEMRFLTPMRLKEEEGWNPPLYREVKSKALLPNQKEEVRTKLTLMRLKEEKGDNLHFRRRRKMLRSLVPISNGR
jgi:hypothetical protein